MSLGGKPKSAVLPKLPSPLPTPVEISKQAIGAGQEEHRRLRQRRGRASTVLAPGFLAPAQIERAGLRTSLG